MSTITERPNSGEIVGTERTDIWLIDGTEDALEAREDLLDQTDKERGEFPGLGDMVRDDDKTRIEKHSLNRWLGYLIYAPKPLGDIELDFSTTGGKEHITQALSHVASYGPAGRTPTDHKGAIGVKGPGDLEGCDIDTVSFRFTCKIRVPTDRWDPTYLTNIKSCTGKLNSAAFWFRVKNHIYTFAAQTLKFLGGRVLDSSSSEYVEVAEEFEAADHLTGQTIGEITGIAKNAFDYLWHEHEKDLDGNGEVTATRLRAVHVERVYREADWSILGISV
jgi:hypothetical protein